MAQARETRDAAEALVAQGIDPNESKQEKKRTKEAAKGETFAKSGQAFLAKQRQEGKTKATLDKTE
ncbi:hypothetical protein [Sulfitobacter aquimarinus]|uniref:hypothetical protein n=1 Tax=Sulfitobacter aquimarinus TaxID=3158557 RepID=UPI003F718F4D